MRPDCTCTGRICTRYHERQCWSLKLRQTIFPTYSVSSPSVLHKPPRPVFARIPCPVIQWLSLSQHYKMFDIQGYNALNWPSRVGSGGWRLSGWEGHFHLLISPFWNGLDSPLIHTFSWSHRIIIIIHSISPYIFVSQTPG